MALAMLVEIEAIGIAAAFGEKFELPGPGMIAPDALLEFDGASFGLAGF